MKVLPYQKLQRHQPAELGVLGLVDDTHAPATQLLDDAVMGNRLAEHGGQSCDGSERAFRNWEDSRRCEGANQAGGTNDALVTSSAPGGGLLPRP